MILYFLCIFFVIKVSRLRFSSVVFFLFFPSERIFMITIQGRHPFFKKKVIIQGLTSERSSVRKGNGMLRRRQRGRWQDRCNRKMGQGSVSIQSDDEKCIST